MRYVSYRHNGTDHIGLIDGEDVLPVEGPAELGRDTSIEVLRTARALRDRRVPLAEVVLRPVVPQPRRIVCVGLNYGTHVAETRRDTPQYPVLFTKFASSLIADGEAIELPPESAQVDYEAELAVVIGTSARRVPREKAMDCVLGYTLANDVTMRDFQYRTHQWLQGKAWDRSTPLGPHLVTADEVDPADLEISLTLNARRMQCARTDLLMFDVATLISTVSTFTTLEAGDVLLTGTPGGVGYRRDPQVFLRAGDVVEVAVPGIGVLRNPVRHGEDA